MANEKIEHTPGPWVQTGVSIMSETPLRLIAVVGAPSERTDEDAYNARLIAAAPDMLGALKAVIDEKVPAYHDCTDDGLSKCAWCIAEDAIAKATGAS